MKLQQSIPFFAVLLFATSHQRADEPWVHHTTFEDFASGTLGNAGVNIYVARAGRIEMLHRLDLNNDGYLDIFVANDHDKVEGADILVYWGRKNGPSSLLPPVAEHLPTYRLLDEIENRRSAALRLPSEGGGRATLTDLNGDGYAEIIFCNFKHNYTIYSNATIYWNGRRGFDVNRRTELATLLPGGVVAEDFNRDGFVDLAFANRGNFEQLALVKPYGHLESYIYWNGPDGFDVKRRTSVPTSTAVDCASGDLNDDGYPELIFANNNFQSKSLSLFWGSAEGFSKDRHENWKSTHPIAIHIADLNGDGKLDLVVTHKKNTVEVHRGTGRGFEKTAWLTLPTIKGKRATSGDLNGDGLPELVVANGGTDDRQVSFVYWASRGGYDASRRSELPTLDATDVKLADFNSDGRLDIAFSNSTDRKKNDCNSYIYWNRKDGFSAADRAEVLGFGPDSLDAADLNRDGHQDLLLVSHLSGTDHRSSLSSFLYWGNARHRYSSSAMTALDDCSALALADINQDGFVDVIGGSKGVIHYGGRDGFNEQRLSATRELKGAGASLADLNRDGYLDLVTCRGFVPVYTDPDHKPNPTQCEILWGAEDGFSLDRSTLLPLKTRYSQSISIADVNKDGFLDLLVPGLETGLTHIFWGAADGTYTKDRQKVFHAHNASTIEVADLDADGWLDLIFGGGWDIDNHSRPTKFSMVCWGGSNGYSRENSIRLPSFDSLEASVADLNKDGHLDIVLTNYHAYFTRRVPAFIYWGRSDRSFSETRRTALPAESSSALTIADFNQDSWLDLFICNHVIDGDHTVGSNLYWGGPEGYSADRRDWVPSSGPHFGVTWDLGNIYDRRLQEEYVSAPLEYPHGKTPSQISWKATTPHGTGVKVNVRSASSRAALNAALWKPVERNGAAIKSPQSHRWLQYRAILSTPDGGSTPYLEEVSVSVSHR